MTKRYRLSSCLVPLLILSACAVDQQQSTSSATERDPLFWCVPKLAAGKGRIWLYRTAPKGIGVPPNIVVNNKIYGELRPGTANIIDVAPGKHEVNLAYFKDKLEVEVSAGDDTFVRFDIDPALFGRGFYPVLVIRQTAQAELHENTGTDFSCVKD